jgi:PKD repeat protein
MRRYTTTILTIAALLVAVAACGGGSVGPPPPGTQPPTITAINPLSGQSGQQVTFNATATGSSISAWQWTFGGGATPNAYNHGPSATVTLGAAGTYNCKVTGVNAWYGTTTNFTIVVTP